MTTNQIILVSNSKSVLNYGAGEKINGASLIVRFNNYEISGFEKSIGNKTDFVFCRCTDDVKSRNVDSFSKIYFVQPPCRYQKEMIRVGQVWKNFYKDKCEIIGPAQCWKTHQSIGLGNPENEWPSVGQLAIGYLLEKYDQLTLFGFDEGLPSHYFQRQPLDSKFHNWKKEKEYLGKLKDLGKIKHLEDEF